MQLCNRFMVRNTKTMGRGVYAVSPVAKGELIGVFPTVLITAAQRPALENTVISQFWFLGERDAALVMGFPELINHSDTANIGHRFVPSPTGEVAEFWALRAIQEGEQLFLDYGFDHPEDATRYFQKDYHRPAVAQNELT
jgi:SET domain-containing protein